MFCVRRRSNCVAFRLIVCSVQCWWRPCKTQCWRMPSERHRPGLDWAFNRSCEIERLTSVTFTDCSTVRSDTSSIIINCSITCRVRTATLRIGTGAYFNVGDPNQPLCPVAVAYRRLERDEVWMSVLSFPEGLLSPAPKILQSTVWCDFMSVDRVAQIKKIPQR